MKIDQKGHRLQLVAYRCQVLKGGGEMER